MEGHRVTSDGHTSDSMWAAYGKGSPGQGAKPPAAASRFLAPFGWLAAIGCGSFFLGAWAGSEGPSWWTGLLGVLVGIGAAAAAAPVVISPSRTMRKEPERSSIATAVAPGSSSGATARPCPIVYEIPESAAADDPQTRSLEERLFGLCRGDRQLFHRLLDYERQRQPDCSRTELLRLAIAHYESDHR